MKSRARLDVTTFEQEHCADAIRAGEGVICYAEGEVRDFDAEAALVGEKPRTYAERNRVR